MNIQPTDLLEQVRSVLPSVLDESELLAAATMLAARLNMETAYGDPYYDQSTMTTRHRVAVAPYRLLESMENPNTPDGTFDPRAFQGRRGGGIVDGDIWSAIPDAASAAQHVVVKGRNKKGTTAKVVRFGVAPVTGRFDRTVDGLPLMAVPDTDEVGNASWAAAQMLARRAATGELHRLRAGWSGIDVERATNDAYSLDDAIQRCGTEARNWEQPQIGRADRAVRFALSGMSFGSIVAQSAEYVSHTSITWPTRYSLRTGRRRQGDPVARRTLVLKRNRRTVAPYWVPSHTVVSLPAPADTDVVRVIGNDGREHWSTSADHQYIGFNLVKRAPVRIARGGRKARTIMAVSAATTPTTPGGWQALAEALNTGDRITAADGMVTICRTKDRYTVTDTREGKVRHTVRTSNAVGIRLAS